MDVALLYVDDCPNWRQTADLLDDLAADCDPSRLTRREPRPRALGLAGDPIGLPGRAWSTIAQCAL